MAERPRGNVIYEFFIVVLVVVLIGTILYPARVWKSETEFQDVCRARMETIHHMEISYIQKTANYSDSIPKVRDVVMSDPEVVMALDSLILWDHLVPRKDLELLVLEKQFPEELRNSILEKLKNAQPLGNLAVWDSLGYRLVTQLREVLAVVDASEDDTLGRGVVWPVLLGEGAFQNLLDSPEVPRRVRTRTLSSVRRGQPVFETAGWRYYRPIFFESLRDVVAIAEREDIWTKEEDDLWEEVKREQWEAEKDGLPSVAKDSLWQQFQARFWEKQKELMWKKERNKVWKEEGFAWRERNVDMWNRVLLQKWESDRKKQWEEETLASLPDSVKVTFPTQKDSLWKSVIEELRAEEFEVWAQKNKKYENEVVENLWERDRRVTWEFEAHQRWLDTKEADKDALWEEIKEELWKTDRDRLWRDEETKLAQKINAQKRLDRAVAWVNVLGIDRVEALVDQLRLPDSKDVWKEVVNKKEGGSALFNLGLVNLFRDTLLNSVPYCPLAHVPYLINVVDTSVVKFIGIRCPIVDTSDVKIALKVDPSTKDTTEVELDLSTVQKLFGGGSIKNHGIIDEEGKKSWEKKRR